MTHFTGYYYDNPYPDSLLKTIAKSNENLKYGSKYQTLDSIFEKAGLTLDEMKVLEMKVRNRYKMSKIAEELETKEEAVAKLEKKALNKLLNNDKITLLARIGIERFSKQKDL